MTDEEVMARNLLLLTLLLGAMGSVAAGIADRVRGVDVLLLLTVGALGLLTGWWLAAISLPGAIEGLAASLLGFGLVCLRVGRLGGRLVALLRAWFGLQRGIWRWLWDGNAPRGMVVVHALADLGADVGTLLTRVYRWATALVTGEAAFDPMAVAFVWSLAFWAVSVWAGRVVSRRGQPLRALTPAGVLLMTAFSLGWGEHVSLLMLLLTAFLLMAAVAYDRRVSRWVATGVDFPEYRLETATLAILLSLALVTLAGTAPSLSVRAVVEFARDLGGGRSEGAEAVAESLGIDQRPTTVFDEMDLGGLPRSHLLGAGPELSERVVMVIRTGELPPGLAETLGPGKEPPRHYWRSHTLDRYAGVGWYPGETTLVRYEAGEPAITPTLKARRTLRQEVRVVGEVGDLLHAAGALVVADHDYAVAWRSPEDPFAATIRATDYRADSLVSTAGEAQLRAAGTDYPDWVRDRYLALPDSVPLRVLSLARDLTATAATPYDRARAIEGYLRRFPYTLDVAGPPSGRDLVDYFLFDLQKGYCDYYATAMAVLARAAGVPARLAVGYASGHYDAGNARYVVTEAEAHAWPEIYFPGYGWVAFEPTAGLPSIERSAEAPSLEWPEPGDPLEPAAGRRPWSRWRWWQILLGGLALLVGAGLAWSTVDRWRLYRPGPTGSLAMVYRRLRRHGRRLAVPMRAGDTAYEFGASFTGPMERLAREGRWRRVWAAAAREIRQLTELYVRASYSPRPPDVADQAQAIRIWRSLRWRLQLARVWRGLRGSR